MNKEERRQMSEKLKKTHKDFEEFTKEGIDWIRFNLGEVKVPEGLEEQRLKVLPVDGKNYLTFTLNLGMDEQVKLKRKQERQKLREEKLKAKKAEREAKKAERQKLAAENKELRQKLTQELKDAQSELKLAIKEERAEAIDIHKKTIGELSAKILETKL